MTGCKITVGHWTCPTNLAQQIEKQFILLNGWTMSIENLLAEPEESQNLLIHFLTESNNTSLLNRKTVLFNNCLFSFLYKS